MLRQAFFRIFNKIKVMGWKAEAKSIKQTKYGHYCKKCRELGIKEVPYHQFEIEMLTQLKQIKL